ncbi:hypothetical protein [Acinetobacter indicus]|uniref:hypothetical protein n=1 Tax=Acinetobacter indicus TaxID=756892 RepID=UPI001444865E|nr:hypothetical protein [Acinetobacter indicus]
MIHYSPMSRYTAQKIVDKVGHGAYFYSHFSVDGENNLFFPKIDNLIKKLTDKYYLDLTPRQRSYRLNTKKEPIADLIVQKRVNSTIFDFWLLITTPNTHKFNAQVSQISLKPRLSGQRVAEVETIVWNREKEQREEGLIQDYFRDQEKFKFVLQKPYLKLNFGSGKYVELVRLSHSTKNSKKYASNRKKSEKNYTWTWRYDEPTVQLIRKKYIEIINDLVSNPNKAIGIGKWKQLNVDLTHYTVFKGNRHQVGRLFTQAIGYHYKKGQSNLREAEYYQPLTLSYLPRQENYAENFFQFVVLRHLFETVGKEFGKENVNPDTYNDLINKYLI